jgi:hypothetical protein
MKTIKIELEVALPETEATSEEIKAWLYYEMGYSGSISGSNPIIHAGESIEVKEMFITDCENDRRR